MADIRYDTALDDSGVRAGLARVDQAFTVGSAKLTASLGQSVLKFAGIGTAVGAGVTLLRGAAAAGEEFEKSMGGAFAATKQTETAWYGVKMAIGETVAIGMNALSEATAEFLEAVTGTGGSAEMARQQRERERTAKFLREQTLKERAEAAETARKRREGAQEVLLAGQSLRADRLAAFDENDPEAARLRETVRIQQEAIRFRKMAAEGSITQAQLDELENELMGRYNAELAKAAREREALAAKAAKELSDRRTAIAAQEQEVELMTLRAQGRREEADSLALLTELARQYQGVLEDSTLPLTERAEAQERALRGSRELLTATIEGQRREAFDRALREAPVVRGGRLNSGAAFAGRGAGVTGGFFVGPGSEGSAQAAQARAAAATAAGVASLVQAVQRIDAELSRMAAVGGASFN